MKKVLFVVSTLRRCGPVSQLYNIVKHLSKYHFQPSIVTLSPELKNSMETPFIRMGISIKSINLSRIKGFTNGRRELMRLINRVTPDLIHSQGIRPDWFATRHLKNIRYISTMRNYPFDDYPKKYGLLAGYLMAWLHLKLLKRFHMVVACSKDLTRLLNTKHKIACQTIENGVDTDYFSPPASNEIQKKIRRDLNLPAFKPILVFCGSLIRRKSPEHAIYAFRNSAWSKSGMLLIVGDGPLKTKCKNLIGTAQNIRLIGEVDNVREFLQASDAFISCAASEGMPNSVLEALACGLPVILSDISPHRQIMEVIKSAGKLTPLNNHFKTAQILDSMLNTIGTKPYQEDIRMFRSRFSASRMSVTYQNLYNSVLS